MKQITVLGIGNILLQDEGFGVKVVDELQRRYRFPDSVQVLDGGTLGIELMRFITGCEKLLVIDAIAGDGPPGSFYRLAGEAMQAYFTDKVSLHELGIRSAGRRGGDTGCGTSQPGSGPGVDAGCGCHDGKDGGGGARRACRLASGGDGE